MIQHDYSNICEVAPKKTIKIDTNERSVEKSIAYLSKNIGKVKILVSKKDCKGKYYVYKIALEK